MNKISQSILLAILVLYTRIIFMQSTANVYVSRRIYVISTVRIEFFILNLPRERHGQKYLLANFCVRICSGSGFRIRP